MTNDAKDIADRLEPFGDGETLPYESLPARFICVLFRMFAVFIYDYGDMRQKRVAYLCNYAFTTCDGYNAIRHIPAFEDVREALSDPNPWPDDSKWLVMIREWTFGVPWVTDKHIRQWSRRSQHPREGKVGE